MSAAHLSAPQAGEHLILYDGVCGLCNRLNQFVLARDRDAVFDFAALQSRVGRSQLERAGRNPADLSTFYVVANYRADSPTLLSKSDAALFAVSNLATPWSWLGLLGVCPKPLLNWGYDLIARNRYRLFGRSESCLLPAGEVRARFIDASVQTQPDDTLTSRPGDPIE